MNYSERNDPHNGGYSHFRFDCAVFVENRGWTPLFTSGTQLQSEKLAKMWHKVTGNQTVVHDLKTETLVYIPELPEGHTVYAGGFSAKPEEIAPPKPVKKSAAVEAAPDPLPETSTKKDLAVALYRVISDKPLTARKICELAGVDYDNDARVKPLMKEMRDAGRIATAEGRWTRTKKEAK